MKRLFNFTLKTRIAVLRLSHHGVFNNELNTATAEAMFKFSVKKDNMGSPVVKHWLSCSKPLI